MLKCMFILIFLFSFGHTQSLIGQDGWLFQQDKYGFQQSNKPASTQKALQHIVVIDKLLKAKDITLILSLTPAKMGLYETQLPEGYSLNSSLEDRYTRALDYLRAEGVLVADVKTAFANSEALLADFPLFQRLDHRWSSQGALLAAEVVAKELKDNAADLLDSIATVEYSLSEIGESTYSNSSLYDLASTELKATLSEQGYYPEAFKQFGFELITESNEGLLKEGVPEIVLVGTSFSQGELDNAWPFHSALQYNLSKELSNVAQAAKGPWEPLSDYLNDAAFSETPPKIIVWELWEPFLEAFGQANLNSDWLINNSSQLAGSCLEPLNSVTKVRSNGRLDFNHGLKLLNSDTETYIEFRLENQLNLSHYLHFQGQFENPETTTLGIELNGSNWQRNLSLAIPESQQQNFNIPLYPASGNAPQSLKLYPGPSTNFHLSEVQICTLPDYVLAALNQPLSEANLGMQTPSSIFSNGLGGVEENYGRWGLGPSSELTFYLNESKTIDLGLAFINPIESQGLELRFNGELLKNYADLPQDAFIQERLSLAGKLGINKLELKYDLWNGLGDVKTSETSMPFAVFFETLGLFEAGQVVFTPSDNLAALESRLSKVSAFPIQDIAKLSETQNISINGFSGVEDGLRRWALGPQSSLNIETAQPTVIQIEMNFFNPIAGQAVSVSFNGENVETISDIASQSIVERSYTLETQAGDNVLSLSYADWNLNNAIISEQDTRPMAILFNQLSLEDLAPESQTVEATTAPLPVAAESLVKFVELIEQSTSEVSISGLAEPDDNQFRWSLGPETQLSFTSDTAESLSFDMTFFNPIDGQDISIRFNGKVVQNLPQVYPNTEMSLKFFLTSSPGLNQLSISYSHINGEHVTFAPNDQRPLALLYKSLNLSLEP